MSMPTTEALSFDAPLPTLLDALQVRADDLPFGVIGLDDQHRVVLYNRHESEAAALPPDTVLGRSFFEEVAQCMNNFLVAQRLLDDEQLDAQLDFVLTLRMRPTPVRLRLIRQPGHPRRYVLLQRR